MLTLQRELLQKILMEVDLKLGIQQAVIDAQMEEIERLKKQFRF